MPSQKSGTLIPAVDTVSLAAFATRCPEALMTPPTTPTIVPMSIENTVSSSVTGSASPTSVETGVPLM